jgi:hypothetical protein
VDHDCIIVIRMGGAAEKIRKKDLTWEKLNPTGVTKPILHPGPLRLNPKRTLL